MTYYSTNTSATRMARPHTTRKRRTRREKKGERRKAHRKNATRDRERSSCAVRDDANIERSTAGVTGILLWFWFWLGDGGEGGGSGLDVEFK